MKRLVKRLRASVILVAGVFDLSTTVALVGLALLAGGIAMIYIPASFIVTGVIILAVSVWPFVRPRTE